MARIQRENTNEITQMAVDLAVILNKVSYIEGEVKDIKGRLESEYVTQDQFEPIKKIVYGLVSIILTAFAVGVVTLFLNYNK
jgi:hypothetical protein